ncbi:MAG TPA: hypothetical protein VL832_23490 [Puia sp.]|nr:hypothetical protein [Puia sp.]
MRFLLAILLILPWPGWALRAQDLTGQWTGIATNNLSDRKQKLVLTIASGDSAFGGVLHWYLPEVNTIRHLVISGRYYGKDSILSIREDSIQDDGTMNTGFEQAGSQPGATHTGRGFSILYYKRIGHKEVLEGHWRDPAGYVPGNGSLVIRLEKKAPPFIPVVLTHKKKDSAQSKQYQELLARKSYIAATIPVGGIDSIKVQLYDNGEIDGDSVSLYLNGELVAGHVKLTATAKTLLLPLDKTLPVNKLLLFAENLGRLPPNTALMEVTVKGKVYNLFLSTDYKRNASVEFTLQE